MVKKQIVKIPNKKPFKAAVKGKRDADPLKESDKRILRLVSILNQLNKYRYVKTAELAKEFNTTTRTVQRDIALLDQAGFPLASGREAGEHKFMEGFSLRKITVSPEEKYLLTILYRLFAGAEGPLQAPANALLSKILITSAEQEDCPESISEKMKEIMNRKIEDVSKQIQVLCQDEPYSQAFQGEIKNFIKEMETKIVEINKRDKTGLKLIKKIDHDTPKIFLVLKVPKSYVSIPEANLYFGGPDFMVGDLNIQKFTESLQKLRRSDQFFLEIFGGGIKDVNSGSEEKVVSVLNQIIKRRDFHAKTEGDYSREELPEEIGLLLNKAKNVTEEFSEQDCKQLNKALWFELYPKGIKLLRRSFDSSIYYEIYFAEGIPDKSFPYFRIHAVAKIYYRFWGPFINIKKFQFLDALMEELGFPVSSKRVDYENSYGGEIFHMTRLKINWEKEINMPDAEKEPFLKTKMLVKHGGSDRWELE